MEKLISGKVREIYEVSPSKLAIVTTDRISAFDVVLSKPVPNKGKLLNAISLFWFDFTKHIVPNHIITSNPDEMPEYFRGEEFEGRTILVRKVRMLPFEFIVRGYMFGNMWEAYSKTGEFCGQRIDGEYQLAERLATPLFTPSTKAHTGHDEYVSIETVAKAIGTQLTEQVRETSLKLYDACYRYAYEKGIIIADTKFEFGLDEDDNLVLADEIFTPDSSRFWDLADYRTGISPKSYDKQFVRDWLINHTINGEMQFENVPEDVLLKTAEIYAECLKRLQNP